MYENEIYHIMHKNAFNITVKTDYKNPLQLKWSVKLPEAVCYKFFRIKSVCFFLIYLYEIFGTHNKLLLWYDHIKLWHQ